MESHSVLYPRTPVSIGDLTSAATVTVETTRPLAALDHVRFVFALEANRVSLESVMSCHLRMGGAFWGLGVLALLRCLEFDDDSVATPEDVEKISSLRHPLFTNGRVNRQKIIDWVQACHDPLSGGYGADVGHDAHVTSTLYALYVLILVDGLPTAPRTKIVEFIKALRNDDGSYSGDQWGEIDARFPSCALAILALLNAIDYSDPFHKKTKIWLLRCMNRDGAFGNVPYAEPHAAYTFCALSALHILGDLSAVPKKQLTVWLSTRQIQRCGGFNGRPEKAPDVCYTWWIVASLALINTTGAVDAKTATNYVMTCQDEEDGGIADRPGDCPDLFHTFFGLAGLRLLKTIAPAEAVDPISGLPVRFFPRKTAPWKTAKNVIDFADILDARK